MLFATLSYNSALTPAAVKAVVAAMAACVRHVTMKTFIRGAIAFCSPQEHVDAWPRNVIEPLLGQPYVRMNDVFV